MTQEEHVQAREINSKHQRASNTRRALRFVGTATGELEVVQEQFHRHQPILMEEICQFSKLLDGNIKQQIVVVGEKLSLHGYMILLKRSVV